MRISDFWRRRHRARASTRRGVAVLLVLLLLSVTLALAYAGMRSQGTTVQIEQNAERRTSARQVAITGLLMALKKMHTTAWAGPGTTLSGSLSSYERFQVTYTAGDATLTSGSSDYSDYPYRVTLLSTGSAADALNPQCVATRQIRMVVRLVPRKVGADPSDWPTMQQYTFYQQTTTTTGNDVSLDIPCRIEGPVRVQGRLMVAPDYPDDSNAWDWYLNDLNAMQRNGYPDDRPVSGPAYLRRSSQDATSLWGLTTLLGVSAVDTQPTMASGDWVNLSSPTSYRIYDGGPQYTIPTVTGTLQGITLGPDTLTNPLGIYYCDGDLTLGNNVTIQGSLFCRGNISITGTNVQLQPVNLPALYDAPQTPVRLPAVTCQKFSLQPLAGGSLTGLLAAFGQFAVPPSSANLTFPIVGRVIAASLKIDRRQNWDSVNWSSRYNSYWWQWYVLHGVQYFPVWMGTQGYNPQPKLTVKPDSTAVAYHWYNQSYPVFVPNSTDADLRWEIVGWTENP